MKKELKKILKDFENPQITLLQMLNHIQEKKGFIEKEDIAEISKILKIPQNEIKSVISFYHFLHTEKTGKYRIYVCTNIPCLLKGSEKIIEEISKLLDIDIGKTTSDGLFSLFKTECIGQCDNAPAVMINERVYKNVTREKIGRIIGKIKEGEKD